MKKTSSIKKIINDARKGKMFILVDNKDRENEGDLVIAAERVTPESINFIIIGVVTRTLVKDATS